jgi:hypothetical protein
MVSQWFAERLRPNVSQRFATRGPRCISPSIGHESLPDGWQGFAKGLLLTAEHLPNVYNPLLPSGSSNFAKRY